MTVNRSVVDPFVFNPETLTPAPGAAAMPATPLLGQDRTGALLNRSGSAVAAAGAVPSTGAFPGSLPLLDAGLGETLLTSIGGIGSSIGDAIAALLAPKDESGTRCA